MNNDLAQRFPYEKAAEALNRLDYESADDIAADMGVSRRTIFRWKQRLQVDPFLQERYRQIIEQRSAAIANSITESTKRIPTVLARSLDFLERSCDELDPSEPEAVRAVTGAISSMSELLFILRKYEEITQP